MLVSREAKKAEAIKRMQIVDIIPNAIEEFKKDDIVNESEGIGLLFWLDDKEKEMVSNFEKENDALVYHVIHSYTSFGQMYSFMYVSDYVEEWELDRNDLRDNMCVAYVYNATDPMLSEFGTICIQPNIGGLMRTA